MSYILSDDVDDDDDDVTLFSFLKIIVSIFKEKFVFYNLNYNVCIIYLVIKCYNMKSTY